MERWLEDIKQDEAKFNKAVKKTIKWLQSEIIRESDLPRKFFKKRAFIGKLKNSIWIGIRPVPVHRLGKPRQTAQGARVRGKVYKGTFVHNGAVFKRSTKDRNPIEIIEAEVTGLEAILYAKRFQVKQKLLEYYNNA